MMMPSLRQIMDFFSAVYAPYGDDEYAESRYDDYNYHEDYRPYMQQFRGVSRTAFRPKVKMIHNFSLMMRWQLGQESPT